MSELCQIPTQPSPHQGQYNLCAGFQQAGSGAVFADPQGAALLSARVFSDLEHWPHRLGRVELVHFDEQSRRQKQRTPQERHLPGGRGRRQVNHQQKHLNFDLLRTYSRSLLDGWRLVQKCNFKGAK